MVVFGPAVRVAIKAAPVALEVARQVDRQLRPHVLAYRLARDVGGYVGRWTADDKTHWVVFPGKTSPPLRAFPPLSEGELRTAHEQLDRSSLKHHAALPEARAKGAVARLRPGRRNDGELGVTVVETIKDADRRDLPPPPPA